MWITKYWPWLEEEVLPLLKSLEDTFPDIEVLCENSIENCMTFVLTFTKEDREEIITFLRNVEKLVCPILLIQCLLTPMCMLCFKTFNIVL